MIKNKIALLLIFIVTVSCKKSQNKTVYFPCKIETVSNKDGFQKIYFENKEVKGEGHFINGKPHGFYKEFYKNGQLKIEGNFQQGKVNGFVKYFDESGSLLFEGHKNDCE